MRMHLAPALIGIAALAAGGQASAQAVVQDHIGSEDVARLFPRIKLTDIALTSETTLPAVRARWGDGYPTMTSFIRYQLDTGQQIELLFSPVAPYGLVRATLMDGTPGGRTLFDDNPRAKTRAYSQISRCPDDYIYVQSVWGPPDYEVGSGMVRGFYEMPDGSTFQVTEIAPRKRCRY